MSEYYGVTRSKKQLTHYGVRGMRWGVRKYLDKNGNVMNRANKYYGKSPYKNASPRKMSRDYNTLDKAYADARAEAIDIKRGNESRIPSYPYTAGMEKMSSNEKMKIYKNQMAGMKEIQSMILKTAKNKGYSISLKSKQRLGSSIKDAQDIAAGYNTVNAAANHASDKEKYYSGYKAKIRKNRVRHSNSLKGTTFIGLDDANVLAHYGIKGMKWGVRKAIERGNDRALSRQYRKAEKKLAKLKAKADSQALLKKAEKYDKVSKGARIAGRVGLGAAAVGSAGSRLGRDLTTKGIKDFWKKAEAFKTGTKPSGLIGPGETSPQIVNTYDKKKLDALNAEHQKMYANNAKLTNISRGVQAGGAGLAALGYSTAVGAKLRARSLRKRAGNAEKMKAARQEAANFQREMNAAFKGTKYAKRKRG